MIEHFQPKVMPGSEAPFSQVVMDDRYAFLAGIVAADFPAGRAVLGDIGAETRAVLEMIRAILDEVGLGMDRIVRVDVHLADLAEFDALNEVYREFFERGREPARTAVEAPHLFGGSKVEITCQVLR